MKRNSNIAQLKTNYLFPEVNMRKKRFLEKNPNVSLISLGVGDTTEPLPKGIASALAKEATALGTQEGYSGYGAEQGLQLLREKIANRVYSKSIKSDDIFISDGAKCDIGRLQMLFGSTVSIAVQDPAYPVYIDGSIIQGVKEIVFMPCLPENGFFPDLKKVPRTDLIYFCSPNNPTGAVATREQLQELVNFAAKNQSIIIYDAAYSNYIQDKALPKSIYEIEGAKNVAIEINSFSKLIGFTGVRLGWTVVPEELKYDNGFSVKADWNRLICTVFNGASNISQSGGCAVFSEIGVQEIDNLTKFYLENANIIKMTLEELGYEVYGGVNAPYLWVRTKQKSSWDAFQYFLEEYHLVTTPGSGFGPSGEGFVRFTAFGHRDNILEATERLKSSTMSLLG